MFRKRLNSRKGSWPKTHQCDYLHSTPAHPQSSPLDDQFYCRSAVALTRLRPGSLLLRRLGKRLLELPFKSDQILGNRHPHSADLVQFSSQLKI